MTDTWQTQEWKDKAAAFVQGKECAWHAELGVHVTENLVPHHVRKIAGKKIYYTHDKYLDLETYCIVLCATCNFQEDLGRRLCPVCKLRYFKPKKKRTECWDCFIKTPHGQQVKAYRDAHPEEFPKKKWRKARAARPV